VSIADKWLKNHNSYLGVIGLIPPENTLRKRTGFTLDEGREAMPELPAFKELVKGLSSRVNIRPLGGAVLWQLSRWIGVLSTKHQFLKPKVLLVADDGAVVIQHTSLQRLSCEMLKSVMCSMVVTRLLASCHGVKKQAGKRGGTAHTTPSILYPFLNCAQ
jgi:hypothetical protein